MDRMLYVAMSNARQMLHAQTMVSQNLANVSTTGFKADYESARSVSLFGPGLPSRAYAMMERPGYNFESGSIEQTGNPFDLAVSGEGWFSVIGDDGTEGLTRDGDFRVSVNGLLTNSRGQVVLGDGGPVTIPPAEEVVIGVDGLISIRPVGQAANQLVQAGRIKLSNPPPDQLYKGADGHLRLKDGSVPQPDAAVTMVQGALESSNVSAVEQLVELMDFQRQYELAVKAMDTASDIEQASAQMMRVS